MSELRTKKVADKGWDSQLYLETNGHVYGRNIWG